MQRLRRIILSNGVRFGDHDHDEAELDAVNKHLEDLNKKSIATYDKATKTVPKIFKDIVFVDQEKEIKEVIDVLQPAFYILEKEVVLP